MKVRSIRKLTAQDDFITVLETAILLGVDAGGIPQQEIIIAVNKRVDEIIVEAEARQEEKFKVNFDLRQAQANLTSEEFAILQLLISKVKNNDAANQTMKPIDNLMKKEMFSKSSNAAFYQSLDELFGGGQTRSAPKDFIKLFFGQLKGLDQL